MKINIRYARIVATCLIMLGFCSVTKVFGQLERVNFSAGLAFHFPNYKNLNAIFTQYNTSRPSLVQQMRPIRLTSGFCISAGTNDRVNIYSLSFSQTTAQSVGIDSIQGFTETSVLAIRARYVAFNYAGRVYDNPKWAIFIGGGFKAGGEAMFFTRQRSIDEIEKPTVNLGSTDILLGFELSPQLHYKLDAAGNFRIVLKPFGYAEFLEDYYSDVNKALNPALFKPTDFNTQFGFPHAVGVELKCLVIF